MQRLQAIKSIALARQYLAEVQLNAGFSAIFRDENHSRVLLALQLTTAAPGSATAGGGALADVWVSNAK